MIGKTSIVNEDMKLELADDTRIGEFCNIDCVGLFIENGGEIRNFCEVEGVGDLRIGKNAVIQSHCTIMTSIDSPWGYMSHLVGEEVRSMRTGTVRICDDACVMAHSVIWPGVVIGEGAVVGIGSLITEDVPSWTIQRNSRLRMVRTSRKTDFKTFEEEELY